MCSARSCGCCIRRCPFVTEELWDRFGYGDECSLIRDRLAGAGRGARMPPQARAELDWVVRLITVVRSVRTEMNVPPSKPSPVLLRDAPPEALARGDRWMEAIRRLARASDVRALDGDVPKGSAQAVLDEATVVLPLEGLIDLAAERARLAQGPRQAAGEARQDRGRSWRTPISWRARRRRSWRKTASGWQQPSPRSRG